MLRLSQLIPEMIDLDEEQYLENCSRIKSQLTVDSITYVLSTMLADIRGEGLTKATTVAAVANSTENKVVATQPLKAGMLLGFYFGTDKDPENEKESDIAKGLSLTHNHETLEYTIVGMIGNEQTRIATLNHAYSLDIIKSRYVFSGTVNVERDIGVQNVVEISLRCLLKINGKSFVANLMGFMLKANVEQGEALLWPYCNVSNKEFHGSYWDSRGQFPLLFNKSGDFISPTLYFPRKFSFNFKTDVCGPYYTFNTKSVNSAQISKKLNNPGNEQLAEAIQRSGFVLTEELETELYAAYKKDKCFTIGIFSATICLIAYLNSRMGMGLFSNSSFYLTIPLAIALYTVLRKHLEPNLDQSKQYHCRM